MNIPNKYEDLTVYQYQRLELLKADKEIDLLDSAIMRLSILSGKSVEYIESLTPKEVKSQLTKALFLTTPLESMPLNETIKLGKKTFKAIITPSDITAAMAKDAQTMIANAKGNYINCLPEVMALCHMELTPDGYRYIRDNHFENVELFKKSKLSETIGAVFFYSKCLRTYSEIIRGCSEVAAKVITDHQKEMAEDKEFQSFLKRGAGSIQ